MYEKIKKRIIEFILNNKLICFLIVVSISSILFSIIFVSLNKCPKCKPCKKVSTLKIAKKTNKIDETKEIRVDVKGEVTMPGVYTLKDGLSVIDAIKVAGGLTENATTKNINLSKHLEDEMVIYVFNKDELLERENTTDLQEDYSLDTNYYTNQDTNTKSKEKTNELVDINTASENELTLLDGIGPSKAKKIIEYRNTNGRFKSIEEIKNVSGIGDKAFEKIKNSIKV